MTSQEKKQYLRRYRDADQRISDLLRERERVMTMLTRMVPVPAEAPRSGGGDKLTDGVAKLQELDTELDARIDNLVSLRSDIFRAIEALPNPRHRQVLRLRYIEGLKWDSIADIMGYESRQIYRLHGRALKKMSVNVSKCQ